MKKALLTAAYGIVLAIGVAQAQTMIRIGPPPPPRVVIPVSPGPRYVWVGGYYGYRGNAYVWMPGRYVIPPRPYAVWMPGRWVRGPNGYYWVAGHWR
jgi:hypothetical protein